MNANQPMKRVRFLNVEIRTPPFGKEARREAGDALRRAQEGEALPMPLSRPMPSIGRRCHELRIDDAETRQTWRIVYRTDPGDVLVAAVFAKKTQATPKAQIDLSRARLAMYDRIRKETLG